VLVGKIKKDTIKNKIQKILNTIFNREIIKNISLEVPIKEKGTILRTKIIKRKCLTIIIYMTNKNTIKIGDKISGRHGNKGIISKITKEKDMPFLQDGTTVDIEN